MNIEGLAILRMLEPDRVHKFLRLTEKHFRRYRDEYRFIVDYYMRYGGVPSLELFRAKFPSFFSEVKDVEVEDEYLIDYLEDARIHEVISFNLEGVIQYLNMAKPRAAYNKLVDIVNECRLNFVSSLVRSMREVLQDLVMDYKVARGGNVGVELILNEFNSSVGGVKEGELFILAARPGVGKTWFLLFNAYNLWRFGAKVLFVSPEMSSVGLARRFFSIHTGLNPLKLRKGMLEGDEAKFYNAINEFTDDRFYILADLGSFTFSDVEAAINEVKPTVLFIDGVYLIKPSSYVEREHWVMLKSVADWIARVSKSYNIPVLASTQIHRLSNKEFEQVGLEDLAYSDAFSQNADFVAYFYPVSPEEVYRLNYKWVRYAEEKCRDRFVYYRFKLLKAREGKFDVDLYVGIDYNDLLVFDVGFVNGTSGRFSLLRLGEKAEATVLEKDFEFLAETIDFVRDSSSEDYPF